MSKLGLIVAGAILGIALGLGGTYYYLDRQYTYQGVLINPPAHAPDFRLTDQNGNPYQLSSRTGKVVLIFFGYTYCPDVCPVTLSEYKQIKASLGAQSADVDFVLITVDPERDTPERLRTYLENFDPAFIGLSGTETQLEAVWSNYGVYRQRQPGESALGYLVDHSARIYAIDPHGQWRLNYPFGMEPERVSQDVAHLLREK
ncbi:MAG: hypothetical protein B6D39_09490 [Anaerolineae bacterium UTCFX2]|jgi:protein SCO1/2|nr:MAG: hypothetical protein B6D39_09490 [Anaerolineae bacterium UTCFX2]